MNMPELSRYAVNSTELSVFEWNSQLRDQRPTVVFAHATGFHARCWDQVIAQLDDCYVIAVDQRGHGRSANTPFETWGDFGDDLVSLLEQMKITQAIGVGHSMGGHTMVQAAAKNVQLFSHLLLIDPVIMSPDHYETPEERWTGTAEDHPTARRRNRFDSVEDMVQRFSEREPYSLFTAEAFRDYCQYGLVENSDLEEGGLVLGCPPAFEASIYMTSMSMGDILKYPPTIDIPVAVLRAMSPDGPRDVMTFKFSPTWEGLAATFPNGRDIHRQDRTHFMPLEDPQMVAELINDTLQDIDS
jgi:lipase